MEAILERFLKMESFLKKWLCESFEGRGGREGLKFKKGGPSGFNWLLYLTYVISGTKLKYFL